MKIGIGLPNHVADVRGPLIVEWARRAERRGFEAVTTIDRLVYPSIDSVVALAVAAGATTDVDLVTNVLLAPLYPPAILAKQLASLAEISSGRLVLGVGVGARPDDYATAGVEFSSRGAILDEGVKVWQRVWAGEPLDGGTPLCPGPVTIPLLFGGKTKPALRRATTLGDGWAAGAVRDYETQSDFADRIRAGWSEMGRVGRPTLQASVNFVIGDENLVEFGRENLSRYYGNKPDYAALNVADAITTHEDAAGTVRAYRDMGFDRLLFHPAVTSLEQVDRLADAVL